MIIQTPLTFTGTIKKVGRHGKYFWITVDEGKKVGHLIMHLGMTGMVKIEGVNSHMVFMENAKISVDNEEIIVNGDSIKSKTETKSKYFKDSDKLKLQQAFEEAEIKKEVEMEEEVKEPTEQWPPKYTKFEITLDTHRLAFTDPRRLGRVRYLPQLFEIEPLSLQGPDYSKNKIDPDPTIYKPIPTFEEFKAIVIKRNKPIKALLLDQKVFAGVGNWVSDEICYRSRIHPGSNFHKFENEEILFDLYDSILSVCQQAVAIEGDIKQMEGWLMLYRWGKGKKKQPKINGESIKFETIGGRTACFVPSQKYYTNKSKIITNGKKSGSDKRKY